MSNVPVSFLMVGGLNCVIMLPYRHHDDMKKSDNDDLSVSLNVRRTVPVYVATLNKLVNEN